MDYEEFESGFGNVAVLENRVEREQGSDMEDILQNFSGDELVDTLMFDRVLSIELEENTVYPQIILKTKFNTKRIFFQQNEEYEECFKKLKQEWRVYRQKNP